MYSYKTRTENKNGCRFFEQDILLLDYIYSNNVMIDVLLDYQTSGFGFVMSEDSGAAESENILLIKFGKENQYQVISKEFLDQKTLVDSFIDPGTTIVPGINNLKLMLKKIGTKITVSRYEPDTNGIPNEITLMSYNMRHDMENFKIGFYSNAGNTIKFSAISSDAPSNWITNIFNTDGGRIKFVKNGFLIENCLYNAEVESENILLEAGKYWFDYEIDQDSDIKAYVYKSYLKDTDDKRTTEEILNTIDDELKNILNDDNSFILEKQSAINIKFKGKKGRITNICIKENQNDKYVETTHDSIERGASWIKFDLNKIQKIEFNGVIDSYPENKLTEHRKYDLFSLGKTSCGCEEIGIKTKDKNKYVFESQTGLLTVNGTIYNIFQNESGKDLYIFKNINGYIDKLTITNVYGDTIDILLQKTFKVTVDKKIKSPIIISDKNENPYDLSAAYREYVIPETKIDLFNEYQTIKLSKQISFGSKIKIFGIPANTKINKNTNDIVGFAENYTELPTDYYKINLISQTISLDQDIRKRYKFIAVQYTHFENYRYVFTNWEREFFDLEKEKNLYIEKNICDVTDNIYVYGISHEAKTIKNFLYRIPNERQVNSIDLFTDTYDVLTKDDFSITQATNKIVLADGIRKKYKYIIIDYLKDNSYCINEKSAYYEIDISTTNEENKIIYDMSENMSVNIYKILNISNIKENDFIVLNIDKETYE